MGFGGNTLQKKGITKEKPCKGGTALKELGMAWGLREEHAWGVLDQAAAH